MSGIVGHVGEDVREISSCVWEERVVVPMVGGFAWRATRCCVQMCKKTSFIVGRVGELVRRGRRVRGGVVSVRRGWCLVVTNASLCVVELVPIARQQTLFAKKAHAFARLKRLYVSLRAAMLVWI